MSSKFKQARAAATSTPPTTPVRVAVPQIDPGEPKAEALAQALPTVPKTEPTPAATSASSEQIPASTANGPDLIDPRRLSVDKSVQLMSPGIRMYPMRHEQILHEAFVTRQKPYEVLDTALAEYFESRYGKP